ncbi:tripartite-type tricarboxylate transporter receptor subunit TctC [Variovorax sp. 54]|uniref:tripartite tricarboxylate transporter substrate-binding protein n=1 Tax=Variovorax sp. 54 TaxID=2035212 RepID=UPI000C19CE6D|nr:tripartite tricarboxylate transporter substrate-binding protein [Variovorax sp. 54]PIF75271.1 tripartite-type tricarboxylate transporter receptor subunit TctC [Variovorax sp. 54]
MTLHPSRRQAVLALLAAGLAGQASAQTVPIRIVVPWAPGGSTDAIARVLAQRLSETMGRTVLVDNRPGAAGQIGTDSVAKAPPDGNSLLIVELPHAIAPAVTAKLPYDLLRDFAPVTLLGTTPLVFFTSADPAAPTDFASFVARAKSEPPLALAHSGAGTVSHLSSELLAARSGLKFTLVPYKGSAPALVDVAGGIVAGHFSSLAAGASLYQSGKLRALAVTSASRIPLLANVPTLKELGVRDMEIDQWWALVAPAHANTDMLEKLRGQVSAVMAHPGVKDKLSSLGIVLRFSSSRPELAEFMQGEVRRWGAVARSLALKPE